MYLGIDIGGTFTDLVLMDATGDLVTAKAPTTPGELERGVFDEDYECIRRVTKLLDQALQAVHVLSPDEQDEIARIILQLTGEDETAPVTLSAAEREAIKTSKAAAGRGEFGTDEEVRAVWAKHGL